MRSNYKVLQLLIWGIKILYVSWSFMYDVTVAFNEDVLAVARPDH